jgi:hypothetical protein
MSYSDTLRKSLAKLKYEYQLKCIDLLNLRENPLEPYSDKIYDMYMNELRELDIAKIQLEMKRYKLEIVHLNYTLREEELRKMTGTP